LSFKILIWLARNTDTMNAVDNNVYGVWDIIDLNTVTVWETNRAVHGWGFFFLETASWFEPNRLKHDKADASKRK